MESETLGFLANLSNSATKLLVYQMFADMDKQTVAEIMRICGFGSRHTYYAAKRELANTDVEGLYKNGAKTALMTGAKTAPGSAKTAPIGVQKMHSGAKTALPTSAENAPLDFGTKSWVELAADTDNLSGEGKREQAKSVVTEAFADMFPTVAIHANSIAQFLNDAKWVCSDVVGAMVVTQENNIADDRVVGYVRKAIRNPVWKGKTPKAQTQTNADNPYSQPGKFEEVYEWMVKKHGKEEADLWRVEELARIGA